MKHRRIARAAGIGAALGLVSGAAAAQGVSGTVIGAPDPGRFAVSFDIGVLGIQMPRFRYGDVYGSTAPGAPSTGSVFDERNRQGGIAPALAFGWGLPSGLFGQRAEAFGQFAFARATESGTFNPGGAAALTLPFVNTGTGVLTGATGTTFGVTDFPAPTFERSFTSYDGQAGMRLHIRNGAWSFSPGAYLGFQRADLDESVSGVQSGFSSFTVNSSVATDYYQVGLVLGTTYNLTTQVALFGIVQGGLDYARSRLDGQSNLFFSGKNGFPAPLQSASDRDNRISGRVGLRGGLAWSPTPAVTVSIAALLQYIGSVSRVVYPSHSTSQGAGAIPTDGTVPARLDSESQLNLGGAVGATIRF